MLTSREESGSACLRSLLKVVGGQSEKLSWSPEFSPRCTMSISALCGLR